ncbi:replication factor A protein 1, partial [Striga asiatica]
LLFFQFSFIYYRSMQVTMSRTYLPISQITDETRNWTALIQVVERAPIQISKSDSQVPYRRYLFTDGEGTKVAAVVYKAAMKEFDDLLLPYKRYYLTGAKVRPETPLYQVGPYEFNWLLHKKTLVEEFEEEVPPQLPCQIEVHPYTENKANVAKLVEEGVYRDTDKLFPYPLASEIVTVQRAVSSIKYTKTCWVAGKLKYLGDNKSLWTATCNNCRKNYNVPPNTPVKCRSCREDTLVEARCRLPIAIEDETGNIHAMLYDSDAERVIPFNGTDLYQAEQQGVDLTAQIAAAMREHHVVCFIKHYESTHHTVLKLYTIVGMQTDKNLLPPTELGKEGSASASNKITDKELFSPTLKNVLNSLTPPREKPTTIAASESTVKKRISFDSHQSSTSGTSIPSTNIPESPTQQTHQTSAMCDASPTKKSRPKMD